MSKYIALRQMERELRRRGRSRNLPGDPLDDPQQVADDLAGQLATIGLWLGLPIQMRRHGESWQMARGVTCPRRRAS